MVQTVEQIRRYSEEEEEQTGRQDKGEDMQEAEVEERTAPSLTLGWMLVDQQWM